MDWTPIRYVHRNYRRDELAGVYRAARVCLVTPLRDGMNLVAKEYVAAQNPDDPGVLVLSRFAGAARQMGEAVIVNPFSREEISEGLKRALSMGRKERVRRWEILIDGVRRSGVKAWRDSFVEALKASHEPRLPFFESPTRLIVRGALGAAESRQPRYGGRRAGRRGGFAPRSAEAPSQTPPAAPLRRGGDLKAPAV